MSKVLVVYATRMGSTREIAQEVGRRFDRRGLTADVCPTTEAPEPTGYDAVVVGSPVYLRRWDPSALAYLRRHAPSLAERPTWLFQSGPCGPQEEVTAEPTPRALTRLCTRTGIAAPVTFGGNLDPARATSWLTARVTRGPLSGDFRDWGEIRAWADGLADQLLADSVSADRSGSR
jgi:menaquinone-dependent protoporphyrinogen oxidase